MPAQLGDVAPLLRDAEPILVDISVGEQPPPVGELASELGLDASALGWLGRPRQPARLEADATGTAAVVPVVAGRKVEMLHVVVHGDDVIAVHNAQVPPVDHGSASGIAQFFEILDTAVGTFRDTLDALVLDVENLEDDMLGQRTRQQLDRLTARRRQLMRLRRAFTPYANCTQAARRRQEQPAALHSPHRELITEHAQQVAAVADSIAAAQDAVGHAFDVYSSLVATEQNAVVNRLTVVATVFLPLTYITGFFGMNFAYLTDRMTSPAAFVAWAIAFQVAALGVSVYLMWRRGDWRILTTEATPNRHRRRRPITR